MTTTIKNKEWFSVNKKGLANLARRNASTTIVNELLQNAFDEPSVTKIWLTIKPDKPKYVRIRCTDNGDGFDNVGDIFTLFNHSKKADSPDLRGRFNIGEKLVISQCTEARISTPKADVTFHADKTRSVRKFAKPRDCDTRIELLMRMSLAQMKSLIKHAERVLPPANQTLTLITDDEGGRVITRPEAIATYSGSIRTEAADKDGILRKFNRTSEVGVYSLGENWIYEMGIPVQAVSEGISYDVRQALVQTIDRNAVDHKDLTRVRAICADSLFASLESDDEALKDPAIMDVLCDPAISDDAFKSYMQKVHGHDIVRHDTNDIESNANAMHKGASLIHARNYPTDVNARIRKLNEDDPKFAPLSSKSKHAIAKVNTSPDGEIIEDIPYENLTKESYHWRWYRIFQKFLEVLKAEGKCEDVTFSWCKKIPGNPTVKGLYTAGHIQIPVGHFNDNNDASGRGVIATFIHELAHTKARSHLDKSFADAVAELSAIIILYLYDNLAR